MNHNIINLFCTRAILHVPENKPPLLVKYGSVKVKVGFNIPCYILGGDVYIETCGLDTNVKYNNNCVWKICGYVLPKYLSDHSWSLVKEHNIPDCISDLLFGLLSDMDNQIDDHDERIEQLEVKCND